MVVTKHPQRICLYKVVSHCNWPLGWLERARKDPMVPEELCKWKCGWASSLARWTSRRLPPTLWSNSSRTNKQQQPPASSSYEIHFMHQSFLFLPEAVKNCTFHFLCFFFVNPLLVHKWLLIFANANSLNSDPIKRAPSHFSFPNFGFLNLATL